MRLCVMVTHSGERRGSTDRSRPTQNMRVKKTSWECVSACEKRGKKSERMGTNYTHCIETWRVRHHQ